MTLIGAEFVNDFRLSQQLHAAQPGHIAAWPQHYFTTKLNVVQQDMCSLVTTHVKTTKLCVLKVEYFPFSNIQN